MKTRPAVILFPYFDAKFFAAKLFRKYWHTRW